MAVPGPTCAEADQHAPAPSHLDAWLADAGPSLLASFAAGITKAKTAVRDAIVEPWSNGQTEGQSNKLMMPERRMYGRAKVDLLEAGLIGAA